MQTFSNLVISLGTSTGTNAKVDALVKYFSTASDKDKVWVIALFSGRKPKRAVTATQLQSWCVEATDLPQWLFDECYGTVGDLAETIALLLPPITDSLDTHETLSYYIEKLATISNVEEGVKKQFIVSSWNKMNKEERFVFNKLITGGFRIGVSQQLMVNALAKTLSIDAPLVAHRISGNWDPSTTSFEELLQGDPLAGDLSKPYPFYLAYALEDEPASLGTPEEWQAEWKWDGIRGQIIKRNHQLFVWSRGEELMTDRFPEFQLLLEHLPEGSVLDGEILPFRDGKPLPFALLQTRIGRKNVTKKQLQDAPVVFVAYDLLEWQGNDFREKTMTERREALEKIAIDVNHPNLRLSPVVSFPGWDELSEMRMRSRNEGSEGLMLKRKNSVYQTGRKRGDWWKWKIDPLVIDCVMIYAQKGHGRRSNLYTDYTFAVKDGPNLVSFTKAYSGLTDKEFAEVDSFVKRNSLERFGPVRTVKPELVFEIAFEGIAASNRHKSGVALRFPRISRWRRDKKPDEINTLDDLKLMLEKYGK
jgi:DNA ligase-1